MQQLTGRLSVAVVRLEAQAIDVEAEAGRSRVWRRARAGAAVLVLPLRGSVYGAAAGGLLVLLDHPLDDLDGRSDVDGEVLAAGGDGCWWPERKKEEG